MPKYKTLEGSEPDEDNQHEARTILRTDPADPTILSLIDNLVEAQKEDAEDFTHDDSALVAAIDALRVAAENSTPGSSYMMTEIEDGVFVAWGDCANCSKRVATCTCKGGPTMPAYMEKWRDERFAKSLRHRKPAAAEVEDKVVEDSVDEGLDAAIEAAKTKTEEKDDNVGF